MKLKEAQNISGYQFLFVFGNWEKKEATIEPLISKYVSKEETTTAHVYEEYVMSVFEIELNKEFKILDSI